MAQERDARQTLPGTAASPMEGPRWVWIKLGVWAVVLLLLAGAAWGVAWTAIHVRVGFEPSRPTDAARREAPSPYAASPDPGSTPGMKEDGPAIIQPDWVKRPEPVFPRAAQRADAETGTVSLTCQADARGRMKACWIDDETPQGLGFGEEAVKAAMKARVRPRLVDGQPLESEVVFTVRYRLY